MTKPHRALAAGGMGADKGLETASIIEETLLLQGSHRFGCGLGGVATDRELGEKLGRAEVATGEQPQCITPRGLRTLRMFRRGVTKAGA